jgi:acetoin utilization deacetylase AcuC-like enzyme
MQTFFSEAHRQHAPESFITRGRAGTNPERPERAERLIEAVRADGHAVSAPNPFEHHHLTAVHTNDYLWFLEHGLAEWRRLPDAGPEIVANAHPCRYLATRPTGVVGLAGYHMADTACPIGEGTWPAALASADCALSAAQAVRDGAAHAYALCRPPGHHAYSDLAGGFCFLNNVAIAAQYLTSDWGQVAILDVDVHHGNGTQGIFYERADVFFASIHADPQAFYPYFAGYADERGAGPGDGFNLNLPLPPGSGDDVFLEALAAALAAIREAAPAALLVSLGLDAQANDPLGVLEVSTDGFARIAAAVAALGLPTVLVQEGGYLCDELGANLASFLAAFAETHRPG